MKSKTNSIPVIVGLLISLSAGLMDVYSFLFRGGVYANAQTGNFILLGVNLFRGNFSETVRYIFPIVFFGAGIALAFVIYQIQRIDEKKTFFFTLIFEALALSAVSFIPTSYNLIANSLISFVCGVQLEMFQKIINTSIATTMCIGNFRLFIQNGLEYLYGKNKESIKKSLLYISVISVFVLGAVLGSFLIEYASEFAIVGSSAVLLVAAVIFLCTRKKCINE